MGLGAGVGEIDSGAGGLKLKGNYNALTNSPPLVDGVGKNGHYYEVTAANTRNFGTVSSPNNIELAAGDFVFYSERKWRKLDQTFPGGGGTIDVFPTQGSTNAVRSDGVWVRLEEKQELDQDLTDFAALTPSNDNFLQRKAGSWVDRTPAQVKIDLGIDQLNNTSDANKPISSDQATAFAAKADLVAGKVPSAQLPSYVDDVLEYANLAALPVTGETGKIYITIDNNNQYRWTGSVYSQITSSPGTTDDVPEGTTNLYFTVARVLGSALAGLSTATNAVITAADNVLSALGKLQKQISDNLTTLTTHAGDTSNIHNVTKAQVGLPNTPNAAFGTGTSNIPEIGATLGNSQVVETNGSGKLISAAKGTAHNKNFGTAADTVAQGNDSRLAASLVFMHQNFT